MELYLIRALHVEQRMCCYMSVGIDGEDAVQNAIKYYNLDENDFKTFGAEPYKEVMEYKIDVIKK